MSGGLSVCIIARDEQSHLQRALESVRAVADEVVVVDTGSQDDTVGLAKRLGARVLHLPWQDDFAAAYNHCFDNARGQWILSLDADEELLPECCSEVRAAAENRDAFAYFVQRQDSIDASDSTRSTDVSLIRLWRNSPQVRYAGRIHSQFASPLAHLAQHRGQHVLGSSIRLRHHRAVGGARPEKVARDLRLLELELRDRPGDFYYLVELGRARLSLGDSQDVEAFRQAAKAVAAQNPMAMESGGALALLLEWILAVDPLPSDFPLSRSAARTIAIDRFPNAVPLLWQLAQDAFRRDRFAESAVLLEKIRSLRLSGRYDRSVSFDPAILHENATLNLGVCYVRLGRLDEAEGCFQSLLEDPYHKEAAVRNLERVAGLRGLQR